MPQIGEIQRGLWVASAFSGHGLNTTAMAGDLIARGIVENDQTWRLFAPYELVWAGGRIGRVVAQSAYMSSRPLTAAAEALARYRERSGNRAKSRAKKKVQTKGAERAPTASAKPASSRRVSKPARGAEKP